jgi:NAD-dependent DNA ligase
MDKATRAAWLRKEITKHDKAYYVDAKPTVTD